MKKIIILVFLFASLVGRSQTFTYSNFTASWSPERMKPKKVMLMPTYTDTNNVASQDRVPGNVIYSSSDGIYYGYNGVNWRAGFGNGTIFGSGGSGGISRILAGYGELLVNDSTTRVDTTLLKTIFQSDTTGLAAALASKMNKFTLTTGGTGAATLINNILNIPFVSGGGTTGTTGAYGTMDGEIQWNLGGALHSDSSFRYSLAGAATSFLNGFSVLFTTANAAKDIVSSGVSLQRDNTTYHRFYNPTVESNGSSVNAPTQTTWYTQAGIDSVLAGLSPTPRTWTEVSGGTSPTGKTFFMIDVTDNSIYKMEFISWSSTTVAFSYKRTLQVPNPDYLNPVNALRLTGNMYYDATDSVGFRNNAGVMEYKNSGGVWTAIGGGGGGAADRFGIEDQTAPTFSRYIELGPSRNFDLVGGDPTYAGITTEFYQQSNNMSMNAQTSGSVGSFVQVNGGYTNIQTYNGIAQTIIQGQPTEAKIEAQDNSTATDVQLHVTGQSAYIIKNNGAAKNIVLSVNGNLADTLGNITTPGGGALATLDQVLTNGNSTTQNAYFTNGAQNVYTDAGGTNTLYISGSGITFIGISAETIIQEGSIYLKTNAGFGTTGIIATDSLNLNNGNGIRKYQLPSYTNGGNGYYSKVLPVSVSGNFSDGTGNILFTLANYANNATAIANGLAVGGLYRNGDVVQVVH